MIPNYQPTATIYLADEQLESAAHKWRNNEGRQHDIHGARDRGGLV